MDIYARMAVEMKQTMLPCLVAPQRINYKVNIKITSEQTKETDLTSDS